MPPVKMSGTAKPINASKTIYRLLGYMGKYKGFLSLVFIAVIISSGAGVACDYLLKPAVNNYIIPLYKRFASGESISAADFIPFLKLVTLMASIFAAGALSTWINNRIMLHISTRTLYTIRTDLFHNMEKLPLRYYDSHTHGELMSLFTNDTDTLRDMLSQTVPQLFTGIVTVTSVFVMMLILSPLLTLVMVITMSLILVIAGRIGKLSAESYRQQQESIGRLNGYIEEMTEGQKVVKVFNYEEKAKAEFAVLNDSLCAAGTRANTFANILMPVMGNLSHVQYALIAVVGAFQVISGRLDLGSIAAFLQYTRSFSRPITMMSQQFNSILNALAGVERIFGVIDEEPETDNGSVTLVNAVETLPSSRTRKSGILVEAFNFTGQWAWKTETGLVKLCGDVEFKDVSFGYVKEKEVLHSVNLHAAPGKKIALVGSKGSGKTTITNLLTRFYDIEEGKGIITYDGIPLKNISKQALRRSLGMVLQDTHLFTGSIKDNIRYGNPDASDAQVYKAAQIANADTFIKHLEQGYDTVITGDGGNLSQGQRQLLSIARAAVADPPVLILDEATSSIDTRTEALIEKGMNQLMEGRTVFIIAHRLSTVRNADEIIVLEKGNIIERGNHDTLMALKGRYYDLYTGAFDLD